MSKFYHYYVEGKCEETLVKTLKMNNEYIYSGAIDVINATQECISNTRIRALKNKTIVVLIYDTDREATNRLRENIARLNKAKNVYKVICIPQVENFEDELLRCTDIDEIRNFTNSKSKSNFKSDFINQKEQSLLAKLKKSNFNIDILWSKIPKNNYSEFGNDASKIKRRMPGKHS
ncbi:hypothetical protein EDX97_08015 [Absicoccus porci]|uniref:RloB domain-containing protein n=1 Tax=Absicoccus porci TaxID=2486576 RepID=A0A3N0I1F0_9FIRM|nr:hypothetical protein [Absicoccus porci]RNM30717.1 hypothetical protein EDX97_08015 [Absicoccus porci]